MCDQVFYALILKHGKVKSGFNSGELPFLQLTSASIPPSEQSTEKRMFSTLDVSIYMWGRKCQGKFYKSMKPTVPKIKTEK